MLRAAGTLRVELDGHGDRIDGTLGDAPLIGGTRADGTMITAGVPTRSRSRTTRSSHRRTSRWSIRRSRHSCRPNRPQVLSAAAFSWASPFSKSLPTSLSIDTNLETSRKMPVCRPVIR